MKINNFYIHRASIVKNKLVENYSLRGTVYYEQLFQIYLCRIFGLCFYRGNYSEAELRRELTNISHNKNKQHENT